MNAENYDAETDTSRHTIPYGKSYYEYATQEKREMNELIFWFENLTLSQQVIVGLVVSLAGGHYATRLSHWALWERYGNKRSFWRILFWFDYIPPPFRLDEKSDEGVPQWLMGAVERLFYTIVVGFGGAAVGAGTMVAWLALKVALNWKNQITEKLNDDEILRRIRCSQVSVLGSLISMIFALLGGLLIIWALSIEFG